MSIRTITHNVNAERVPLDTVYYGGVRFEDNATSVQFVLDNKFKLSIEQKFKNAEITYRIDFNGEISGYNPSENLIVIDNKVTRPIPLCMTAAGEQITAVLVATALDGNGEAIGTVSSVPIKIYFDSVSRDESNGVEISENLSAIEQKTREICAVAKTFSNSASNSAAFATAAADCAVEAMTKTEDARFALENGAEFVLLGGDALDSVGVELVIDEDFSDVSENPVQNKVISTLKPIRNHRMFGNSYTNADGQFYSRRWYYVDNNGGNDNNSGDSWDSAFRTLQKALDTANAEGNHDTRIALMESDVAYEYPYASCAIEGLHISGCTKDGVAYSSIPCNKDNHPPVTIHFSNQKRSIAFYCGHVNFTGLKITKAEVTDSRLKTQLYADGGMFSFNNCEIDTMYQQNGGTVWVHGCYISSLYCEDAVVRFSSGENTFMSTEITHNTDNYRLSIKGGSGTVYEGGGLLFEGGNNNLIRLRNTRFSYQDEAELSITSAESDTRDYDLASVNSILWLTEAQWNNIPKKYINNTLNLNTIADYIVEQGKIDIWTYRKWNSGIVECWGRVDATNVTTITALGNGYYSEPITVSFPFPISPTAITFGTRNAGTWITQYSNNTDKVEMRVNSPESTTYENFYIWVDVKGTLK